MSFPDRPEHGVVAADPGGQARGPIAAAAAGLIILLAASPCRAKPPLGFLLASARDGHADIIKILLAAKADPKASDHVGNSVLSLAASAGSAEAILLLAAAGVELNARDFHGWTPLMYAVMHRRADVVRALLASGAKPDVAASDGETTPLSIATAHHFKDMVDVLESASRTPVGETVVKATAAASTVLMKKRL
jgi:ankyrin repeat protein